MHYKLFCWLQQ